MTKPEMDALLNLLVKTKQTELLIIFPFLFRLQLVKNPYWVHP